MPERSGLREALAAAISAAQRTHAPARVIDMLRGAYRTLESNRFVDSDMIRWAEAGLAAWQRWSAMRDTTHRILVVEESAALSTSLRQIAAELGRGTIISATSINATLEALARHSPAVIVFDLDARTLVPTIEMLEWLATEMPQIHRIGYTNDLERENRRYGHSLYHALLTKPPTRDVFLRAAAPLQFRLSS